MSQSEVAYTIKALSSDSTAFDITEMMYISICFNTHHDFTRQIISEKGIDWLNERLAFKWRHWVPVIISDLELHNCSHAVESYIDMVIDARNQYSEVIEPLCSLEHLARIRREAHIHAGKKAIKYILSLEERLRQPSKMMLGSALLAEVPKEALGNPDEVMCEQALGEIFSTRLLQYCNDEEKEVLKRADENTRRRYKAMNELLNPLLETRLFQTENTGGKMTKTQMYLSQRDEIFLQYLGAAKNIAWRTMYTSRLSTNQFVVLCIQVDSPWKGLAETFHPGYDWQEERDQGIDPVLTAAVGSEVCELIAEYLPDSKEIIKAEMPAEKVKLIVLANDGVKVCSIFPKSDIVLQ